MTKITIDGNEFETDTFNELQNKALQELQLNQAERERIGYTVHLLELRAKALADSIASGKE